MLPLNRRQFLESSLLTAGAVWLGSGSTEAAPPHLAETRAGVQISGEERNAQSDIWCLEVNFKPVRMILVDLPNPKTGKTTRQRIWYLAYRAINRANGTPVKTDRPEDWPTFVPEFTLVTDDNGEQKSYLDRVMPVAQAAINKRERTVYKNSVEIVGPLPPVSPDDAKLDQSLNGVATWRGIDPKTDYFKVFMTGFSNGYRVIQGPDGSDVVQRKTLVQNFWRPSDEFDENEEEIRQIEQPTWIYR